MGLVRFLLPLLLLTIVSWLARALLRTYLRRTDGSSKPFRNKSSAKVVEGSYHVKNDDD
jgi:hypothetical protein